jgi:predicted TIM-barrel enzyme
MNRTQQVAAKWDKIWAYLRSIGCEDQLGEDTCDLAISFITKLSTRCERAELIVKLFAEWCERYPESSTSPMAGLLEFRKIEASAKEFINIKQGAL